MQNFLIRLTILWTDYRYLMALGLFVLWLFLSKVVASLIDRFGRRIVEKTKTDIDDIIFREIKLPLWFLLILLGVWIISQFVALPPRALSAVFGISQTIVIFLLIYAASRILIGIVRVYGVRSPTLTTLVPTFSQIINIVIWGIGLLMILDTLGISITPMLGALGIGGLAIGLALQDTLANFFAGIYILLSQPLRVGDYIRLESGEDGYVVSIGWRETRIRTLPNNIVVIPNQKLSQMIITNYYIPDKEMACLVQVGVSYGSDLEKVERVTIEVGKEVLQRISGGVKTFEPFIRYHTFSDFSINFTVILRVSEFVDKYLVTHEFIKALHKRYKEEGIEIPFPIRTVYLNKQTS